MTSQSSASPEEIVQRFRQRREDLGASIDQLATWSGLEAGRVREIEAGATLFWREVDAICRGLAVDTGAMIHGKDRSPRRSVARFRSASSATLATEDLRLLALAAELGRVGGFLASALERPLPLLELRDPVPLQEREAQWREGYRLGETARRSLGLGAGPIDDLEALLARKGVHVARVAFSSEKIDAASLWETDALPIILVNLRSQRAQSPLSRRSLLAHELCHLLHDSGERDIMTQLSWQEGSGNYGERVERRARAFAPALLAPPDEVRHYFRSGSGRRIRQPRKKVEVLARRWGFSMRGAGWHAKNCGLIQERTVSRLSRELPDEDHPWAVEFERSAAGAEPSLTEGLLAELTREAVAIGLISSGRGREISTWM